MKYSVLCTPYSVPDRDKDKILLLLRNKDQQRLSKETLHSDPFGFVASSASPITMADEADPAPDLLHIK
jgi:hypothetical protein